MPTTLDREVTALARRLAELGAGEHAHVYDLSFWSERLLSWAMAHPEFKTQLFRFVDVFPATVGNQDIASHLHEYFDGSSAPRLFELGVELAEHAPLHLGETVSAAVARRNIARMAQQFIVGTTPADAVVGLERLWRSGSAFTVDLLGEKTVTEEEADRYAARVNELLRTLSLATKAWAPDDLLEYDDRGPLARVNISLKPTALASLYAPLTRAEGLEQASSRLRPIFAEARRLGACVYLDMEHYEVKDLTLELFRSLLADPDLADLDAGVVVQAYLRDSYRDLTDLLAWASERPRPITVRLVKGAYWDAETAAARAAGWPVPVFGQKAQTDANYDRCARALLEHHDVVRAAFASHNLRSLAYAVSYARILGLADSAYELQMLYGMAEPIQAAVKRMGLRLRVYTPVGALIPGMAYLVRRLLENTSNESFVRHRFVEGADLDALLAPPMPSDIPEPEPPARRRSTDPGDPGPYDPEPLAEWRRGPLRAAAAAAVRHAAQQAPIDVPALIDGERVVTADSIPSVDPAWPRRLVARSAACTEADIDAAVGAAAGAFDRWRSTAPHERAAVLWGAAEWMRARRCELVALEVYEVGKPWREADADVCEAIDYCEYYGREMVRLAAGGTVQSPPGEANQLTYAPKGVVGVISPWNFPLAIPTGMVTAALVAGNSVVLKPAEQAPATASMLVRALEAAGLPPGVVEFVPGLGEVAGAALVAHPTLAAVAFTGSRPVGLGIVEAAARHQPGQRCVKRVVAEMGGKNAIVVDADADLDQAVPAIASSAFGFAGQKCSAASRVVVVDAIHDEMLERLVGVTRVLVVGHPEHMGVAVGPVIDQDAHTRIHGLLGRIERMGRVVLARDDVPVEGYFVGPTIVDAVDPGSELATEEIFGPVLAVLRAPTFEAALELANATDYALTAGVFSRTPSHIRRASAELRAGNVYVNRAITGAVVGRQPFGGNGLSGVGSKAGGPDYLLQFTDPRVTSENTLLQGFAPEMLD